MTGILSDLGLDTILSWYVSHAKNRKIKITKVDREIHEVVTQLRGRTRFGDNTGRG